MWVTGTLTNFNYTFEIVRGRTELGSRASIQDRMMLKAALAALNSTCNRANVGCVIFNENLEFTGYNGASKGQPHCTDEGVGCLVIDSHCRRAVHAEMNAIFKLNKTTESKENLRACVTHTPCFNCLNLLIASEINTIYILNVYKPEHLSAFKTAKPTLKLIDFTYLEEI